VKEIAHFKALGSKLGFQASAPGGTDVTQGPLIDGTDVPFTGLAIETKVSLTMCSQEAGWRVVQS
jgi:hypothetical protein